MTVRRGDVILLVHPFSDASGTKVRPALVVQNDADNERLSNTIVAIITGNLSHREEPTQIYVDVSGPSGLGSGLHSNSLVSCNNLFTVHESRIYRTIGQLPPESMQWVDMAIKSALGL